MLEAPCRRIMTMPISCPSPGVKIAALIVAAGRGSRAVLPTPKQYALLAGEPVLRRTLHAFASYPSVDLVTTVIRPDDAEAYADAAAGLAKLAHPVPGGD